MGDKNNSPSPGIQFLKQRQNLERSTGIQVSRSLIGQNQYRIVHQRPGYSHPLLLSSGHLVRLFVELVAKAHALKRPDRALAALALAHTRERERQLHVAQYRLVRNEVIALEDKADGVVAVAVPVGVGKVLRRLAVDDEIAARIVVKAADDVEQRRLAAA